MPRKDENGLFTATSLLGCIHPDSDQGVRYFIDFSTGETYAIPLKKLAQLEASTAEQEIRQFPCTFDDIPKACHHST